VTEINEVLDDFTDADEHIHTPPLKLAVPSGVGNWRKLSKADAMTLLTEYNQSNRPMRPAWVKRVTSLMDSGNWNFATPDPIVIARPNEQGVKRLLNGQHRLTAFFDSTLNEAWFYIMEDVDESTFETMDQGQRRSAADFYFTTLGISADDVLSDGSSAIKHHKAIVTIALCMERMQGFDALPGNLRFSPAEQSRVATRYRRVVEPIIDIIRVKQNDSYATPVVAAFANAARRYGLKNILPLATRYASEAWADNIAAGKVDPLKLLHQLIRGYNAKDRNAKRRANDQKMMYAYAVAAIRSALCKSEHWVARLCPPKTHTDFGDSPQWEARISQSIAIQPEVLELENIAQAAPPPPPPPAPTLDPAACRGSVVLP